MAAVHASRELCHHVEVELAQGVPERTGRLVIVCGLPGSGKTILAKQLSDGGAAVRMSPDDWMEALGINLWDTAARGRIEGLQWQITRDLLVQGISVVIEWGTWARVERDALRLGARELGASVELRYLDVDLDELWNRVSGRRMEDPPMTRADLEQWFMQFEVPGEDELNFFDPW
jgi:predicted kinase